MDKPQKPVRPVETGRPLPTVQEWNDTGRMILEPGTRRSAIDHEAPNLRDFPQKEALDILFELMNTNLQRRRQTLGKRPRGIDIRNRKERLSGLFGSGK